MPSAPVPCSILRTVIEKVAAACAGKVRVLQFDADASAVIAARHRVRALPTVNTFVGGQEQKRHTGATSMERPSATIYCRRDGRGRVHWSSAVIADAPST